MTTISTLKTKTVLAVATAALSMGYISAAQAYDIAEMNGYVTGKVGVLKVDNSDFSDETEGYQFTVGASPIPYMSIEASYHDFGDTGNEVSSASSKGYSLAAVGDLPVTESFGLFAKIGNLWWDSDYTISGVREEDQSTDIFYGVGGKFEVAEQLNLVLSYDRYKIAIDRTAGADFESDLDLASLGLNFSF